MMEIISAPVWKLLLAGTPFYLFAFGLGIAFCGILINRYPEANGFKKLPRKDRK